MVHLDLVFLSLLRAIDLSPCFVFGSSRVFFLRRLFAKSAHWFPSFLRSELFLALYSLVLVLDCHLNCHPPLLGQDWECTRHSCKFHLTRNIPHQSVAHNYHTL